MRFGAQRSEEQSDIPLKAQLLVHYAFLHRKMAISFLWPVWKGKIKAYSAMEHIWVQVVDFFAIIVVNILLSSFYKF